MVEATEDGDEEEAVHMREVRRRRITLKFFVSTVGRRATLPQCVPKTKTIKSSTKQRQRMLMLRSICMRSYFLTKKSVA